MPFDPKMECSLCKALEQVTRAHDALGHRPPRRFRQAVGDLTYECKSCGQGWIQAIHPDGRSAGYVRTMLHVGDARSPASRHGLVQ